MPVFNTGSELLWRSVGSVRNQTLEDIEIILIDDCSLDDSWEFICSLRNLDNRIRIHQNKERSGTLFSRTTGVRMARGKYIMWLDPDDEMLPEAVREAYECAEETGADVVDFQAWEMPANGKRKIWNWREPLHAKMNNKTLINSFRRKLVSYTLWRKIFKRSVYLQALDRLGDNGYLPMTMSDDLLHCGTFFKFAQLFVKLRKRLVIYYTGRPKRVIEGAPPPPAKFTNTSAMADTVAAILTDIYGTKMYGSCL